ncbi:hypothetical protein K461DRAFT_291315 [Myriangium duriaei CBS 260.36]|uniref:Uncharacterized protein n=1 Tax=Myriangium duriaei CBS 260.36 TaxID=1168546 RepID=A0A9P4J6R2_9PEZI|nr:hypothetical protein K461DRAFT_291315 [Myriangium duriaei CBS 260.36]
MAAVDPLQGDPIQDSTLRNVQSMSSSNPDDDVLAHATAGTKRRYTEFADHELPSARRRLALSIDNKRRATTGGSNHVQLGSNTRRFLEKHTRGERFDFLWQDSESPHPLEAARREETISQTQDLSKDAHKKSILDQSHGTTEDQVDLAYEFYVSRADEDKSATTKRTSLSTLPIIIDLTLDDDEEGEGGAQIPYHESASLPDSPSCSPGPNPHESSRVSSQSPQRHMSYSTAEFNLSNSLTEDPPVTTTEQQDHHSCIQPSKDLCRPSKRFLSTTVAAIIASQSSTTGLQVIDQAAAPPCRRAREATELSPRPAHPSLSSIHAAVIASLDPATSLPVTAGAAILPQPSIETDGDDYSRLPSSSPMPSINSISFASTTPRDLSPALAAAAISVPRPQHAASPETSLPLASLTPPPPSVSPCSMIAASRGPISPPKTPPVHAPKASTSFSPIDLTTPSPPPSHPPPQIGPHPSSPSIIIPPPTRPSLPQAPELYRLRSRNLGTHWQRDLILPLSPSTPPWATLPRLPSVLHAARRFVRGQIVHIRCSNDASLPVAYIRDIRCLPSAAPGEPDDGRRSRVVLLAVLWCFTREHCWEKGGVRLPEGMTHGLTTWMDVVMWDTIDAVVDERKVRVDWRSVVDVRVSKGVVGIYTRDHRRVKWVFIP